MLRALLVFSARPRGRAVVRDASSSLKLPDATITMAQSVAAGAFTPPQGGGRGGGAQFADLPAFCRVAATLKPSADSDIKIEVWLPASGWNGKFQATGNGGWNGNIDTNALAAGIRRGYATASTDTGHQGGGGPWMQNREKLIDYGYRAVHEMTVKGKAIVAAFYGNAAAALLLHRLLRRRTPGPHRRAALPRRLRRHRRRRAGAERHRPRGVRDVRRRRTCTRTRPAYIPATKYPAIHNAVLAGVRRATTA